MTCASGVKEVQITTFCGQTADSRQQSVRTKQEAHEAAPRCKKLVYRAVMGFASGCGTQKVITAFITDRFDRKIYE